jgi:hypothetical protein
VSTLSDLDGADATRLTPPPAEANDERDEVRRTLRTIVLAAVIVLVAIGLIVWATAPLRQINHLYATPTLPLAVADAKDAAAKAAAAAQRAQEAADRARAVTASRAADQ